MTEMIGLDIGSHSIKLVGLKMTSKGPFLTCLGMKEIPYGTDKEDIHTFSEILKSLLKETGLKTKKVNLVVSGSNIHIKRISIPSLPKAELKEAVRWEIKDSLPYPVETAQIDFHILNEYVEENVKKLDVITVACPKELIDRTLSICEGAGFQPSHLDIGPFALWKTLLFWNHIKKEETTAVIDLGSEKTGIYLFDDKMLQFCREVTPAEADITRAIIEGIDPTGEPELLHERAEGIKREIGIPSDSYQEKIGSPPTSLSKISFLIRPVLEKLAAEIERSLEYYKSQFNLDRIDRVLLIGGGAHLKGIVSYLSGELRLSVEHFNPLEKVLFDSKKINPQLLNQMGSIFTIAIGMAIPEPNRIELLPSKKPFLSEVQVRKLIPVIVPMIVFVIFLSLVWYMNGQVRALEKERDTKMAKLTHLEMIQQKLKQLKEKELQIKEKLSQFPSSMMISVPYPEILKEASRMLPSNVALTVLSVHPKETLLKMESSTDQGRELHLSGLAFGDDVTCLTALALIIERLEKSRLYKNVRLISADENKLYTRPGAGFEIVCDLHLDGHRREP